MWSDLNHWKEITEKHRFCMASFGNITQDSINSQHSFSQNISASGVQSTKFPLDEDREA